MSQRLINLSPDLRRLRDEGYDIEIRSGYLLLKDIPYVTRNREVARGALVSELTLTGDTTTKPSTHVVSFTGDHPCTNDGKEIEQIRHTSQRKELADGLVIDRSFSNKPRAGYADYYEKMTTYTSIIGNFANAIDRTATARTFPVIEPDEADSVFQYVDTASSRAGIAAVSRKLESVHTVVIVGLGGTGSYILDLVAKTSVGAIHLYDGDVFSQHNAFRCPGAASIEELREKPNKAPYFANRYSKIHRYITAHGYVDESNIDQLSAADFVFLSLDKGAPKRMIVKRLEALSIPFIDVGIGVTLDESSLGGIVRVTSSTDTRRAHIAQRVALSDGDGDNEYASNIQVADLNALNAALAVVKWKKLCGFYRDLEKEHHSTYTIDGNILTNEEQG